VELFSSLDQEYQCSVSISIPYWQSSSRRIIVKEPNCYNYTPFIFPFFAKFCFHYNLSCTCKKVEHVNEILCFYVSTLIQTKILRLFYYCCSKIKIPYLKTLKFTQGMITHWYSLLGPWAHKMVLGSNPVVCRWNSHWPSAKELDLGSQLLVSSGLLFCFKINK